MCCRINAFALSGRGIPRITIPRAMPWSWSNSALSGRFPTEARDHLLPKLKSGEIDIKRPEGAMS